MRSVAFRIVALGAVLVTSPVALAASTAQPPTTLYLETVFFAPGVGIGRFSTRTDCNLANASRFSFRGSGAAGAYGAPVPYPGKFKIRGSVTLGPQLMPGLVPVNTIAGRFSVKSKAGHVSGRFRLVPPRTGLGQCKPFGGRWFGDLLSEVAARNGGVRYEARIKRKGATFLDRGYATIVISTLNNEQTLYMFFDSDLAAPIPVKRHRKHRKHEKRSGPESTVSSGSRTATAIPLSASG